MRFTEGAARCAASNEHARNPLKWRGTNLLGFALMEARAALGGALGAPD